MYSPKTSKECQSLGSIRIPEVPSDFTLSPTTHSDVTIPIANDEHGNYYFLDDNAHDIDIFCAKTGIPSRFFVCKYNLNVILFYYIGQQKDVIMIDCEQEQEGT